MKNLTLALFMVIAIVSCTNNKQTKATTADENKVQIENSTSQGDVVQVLYFHGKQRCATCNAIEKETKSLLESKFSDEMGSKKIDFKVIDISLPENQAIADKYEVASSSLLVNDWKNGSESVENLTEFAFANARTNPDAFKKELADKINGLLAN